MALKESTNENFDFISAKEMFLPMAEGFNVQKEIDANNLSDFSKVNSRQEEITKIFYPY